MLKSQAEIARRLQEAAERTKKVRETAESLRGAQAPQDADAPTRNITVVNPPPSPVRNNQR